MIQVFIFIIYSFHIIFSFKIRCNFVENICLYNSRFIHQISVIWYNLYVWQQTIHWSITHAQLASCYLLTSTSNSTVVSKMSTYILHLSCSLTYLKRYRKNAKIFTWGMVKQLVSNIFFILYIIGEWCKLKNIIYSDEISDWLNSFILKSTTLSFEFM